jgi:outer membrane protein W
MTKRLAFALCLVVITALPAFAQDHRGEIGVVIGGVFSDGVSTTNSITAPDKNVYNRVDPKDSFGWGIDVGAFIGEKAEVGFMYTQQPTKLQFGGTTDKEIGDLSIHTYHVIFTYNFGEADSHLRPYVFGGLGGTSFGDVSYVVGNTAGTISGSSRFSSTWGAGVKWYGTSRIGARFGLRFTPTYVKSDAAGWWCDPYWGCYLTGDAQYSNQVDINGGVTFRF